MNKDIFEGKWRELKGKIKEEWNDLTDDELEEAEGKAEKIAGRLQAKYGWSKEESDSKFKAFVDKLKD